jgi:hypothetical protein
VLPPVFLEGFLLLALQGLGVVVLVHTVLGENSRKIRFNGTTGTKEKQALKLIYYTTRCDAFCHHKRVYPAHI